MRISRAAIKSNARLLMREHKPQVYLIGLLLAVLSLVLFFVFEGYTVFSSFTVNLFSFNKFDLGTFFSTIVVGPTIFLASGLSLVLTVVLYMLRLGYTSYALNLTRQKPGSYGNLLNGFKRFGRAFGVGFFTWLFTFLWTLLYMFILVVFLAILIIVNLLINGMDLSVLTSGSFFDNVYNLVSSLTSTTGLVLLVLLGFLAAVGFIYLMVLIIRVALRYVQAPYLLFDHPELSALDCVRESKQIMKGRKGEYFVLGLSFIGWILLAALPAAILAGIGAAIGVSGGSPAVVVILATVGALGSIALSIYIQPYIELTFAGYYTAISDLYFANVNYIKAPFPGYGPDAAGNTASPFRPQPGAQPAPAQQQQPEPPKPPKPAPQDHNPLPPIPDLPPQPEPPKPLTKDPSDDDFWEIGKK
ncbi:MAG: DUF975 family protein [Firmicutes bacterium]|nr:DUF975 family protein [Bacillota bacterium]